MIDTSNMSEKSTLYDDTMMVLAKTQKLSDEKICQIRSTLNSFIPRLRHHAHTTQGILQGNESIQRILNDYDNFTEFESLEAVEIYDVTGSIKLSGVDKDLFLKHHLVEIYEICSAFVRNLKLLGELFEQDFKKVS